MNLLKHPEICLKFSDYFVNETFTGLQNSSSFWQLNCHCGVAFGNIHYIQNTIHLLSALQLSVISAACLKQIHTLY